MSSWRWTRTPTHVTATCDACGTTFTQRTDADLLRAQRGHDIATCIAQQRAARVAAMADTDESPTASTVYKWRQGRMVAVSDTRAPGCDIPRLGAMSGTIETGEAASDVSPKPPLDTPIERSTLT